jgi:hypothetical protein
MSDQTKLEDVAIPTVLMFRPKKFERVPPEKMAEWMGHMRSLGAGSALLDRANLPNFVGCYSFCDEWDFDDCDQF